MKPYLLYKEYPRLATPYSSAKDLVQDLNLDYVLDAMSDGDAIIREASKATILIPLTTPKEILYRHAVMKDCIQNSEHILNIYNAVAQYCNQAVKYRESTKFSASRKITPSDRFRVTLGQLELVNNCLEKAIPAISNNSIQYSSEGMNTFVSIFTKYFDVELLANLKKYYEELRFVSEDNKTTMSASLGLGLKGVNYTLNSLEPGKYKKHASKIPWPKQIILKNPGLQDSAQEIKFAALIQINKLLSRFLTKCNDYLMAIFTELGFYVGAFKLMDYLNSLDLKVCFPEPKPLGTYYLTTEGVYDLSLAIREKTNVVANSLSADSKNLFIITGTNQGGKSTFLRSIGLSQLLMQCGLFVAADSFSANLCDCMFTHFTREEDSNMDCGKLAEELDRMDKIIEQATFNSFILMNEPFATTTENEGSEITTDIINSLYNYNIKTFIVTHLFVFADGMYKKGLDRAIFLMPERMDDGGRTFNIRCSQPLQTSFGEDLYDSIMKNI